uniref:Putative transporter C11D3.18C n=1 Tax=Anthurium amnicola TaxID=1678845 RepID=A0A1D1ZAS2_9ARAE
MESSLQKDGETVIISNDNEEKFVEDKEFEKKLLRKVDLRIIPLLTLLYLLSFLDRVNIGNAKLAFIEKDLGLVGTQFNWCLSVFFIGYILFEIPSNYALLKIKPFIWIPFIMVSWGVVITIMAFVKNFQGLVTARFFLGACEAGLFPGAVYYLTTWYKRSEQNSRIAFFAVGSTFAGSFNGLLAYGLIKLDGKHNLRGWQWLFLVEGIITIVVSLSAYFFISDYPKSAKWLTDKERKYATDRLKYDAGKAYVEHYERRHFYAALTDFKVYLAMLYLAVCSIAFYSYALFLPTIVNGMGFNYVVSQLLSVPPYFCATVSTITVAIISDHKRIRGPFIIGFSTIGIIGYSLLASPSVSNAGKYVGVCIVGIGLTPSVTTSIAWLTNNIAGHAKRGIATAMVMMCGNLGGIIASQIYRQKDFPHYIFGHSFAMGSLACATFIAILQYIIYKTLNKRKKENPKSFLEGKSEEEIKNLGDLHPDFIYNL